MPEALPCTPLAVSLAYPSLHTINFTEQPRKMNVPSGRKRKVDELNVPVQERKITRREPNTSSQSQGNWIAKRQAVNNRIQEEERHREFLAQETRFLLQQKRKAAEIRVREGRAKPLDWLVANLRILDPVQDLINDDDTHNSVNYSDPETVIDNLTREELPAVCRDIDGFLDLEDKQSVQEYWRTLRVICKERQRQLKDRVDGRDARSVSEDITRLLAPKSYEQLERLEKQITRKLDSDEPIDTEYWQRLLDNLLVYKARAGLKNLHAEISGKLCKQVGMNQPADFTSQARPPEMISSHPSRTNDSSLYDQEAAKGVEADEEVFAAEEDVSSKTDSRPQGAQQRRKPRYFNRVQTGYDWNKYNQTHYDHDNPPPKVVQGYKFHIFYPDLTDPSRAPTYKIIREGGRRRGESLAPAGEEDTCIIRFIAGPPYEDLAFRIVDRDWDYSAKNERGFRSTFENGILTLHFSFRKIFYRK